MAPENFPPLTLYRGSSSVGQFAGSPFVAKLETRLRLDDVPYKVGKGSPKSAPRGKIPYVDIGSGDGEHVRMGDSVFIIRHLAQRGITTDLNAHLTPVQRAQDLAIRALIEDKAYFYLVREKWCDNYTTMRDSALSAIPWPMRWLIGLVTHRAVTRALYGQGTGRFTDDEVSQLKQEAWDSINELLSEAKRTSIDGVAPFWVLGGEGPSEADATVFGFVASVLVSEAAPTTRKVILGYPVVVQYVERISTKYFPDYKRWDN